MDDARVTINVEFSDAQALAFAQFLKRVGLDDYRGLAVDQDEAYAMRDAGDRIRRSLADVGYAPR